MHDNTSHKMVLLYLFVCTILISLLSLLYIRFVAELQLDQLSSADKASVVSLSSLISFWVVYFNWSVLRIASLRKYLDDHTYRLKSHDDTGGSDQDQEKLPEYVQRNDALRQRANANIVSQGIFMTVVSMLIGPILNKSGSATPFQHAIQTVIPLSAMLTISFLLWSIDLLDTTQNVFRGTQTEKLLRMRYFFREVATQGSASLRFFGFSLLSVFLFLAMTFFQSNFTAIGIGVFLYIGYPIAFGYKGTIRMGEIHDIDIDRDCRLPMKAISIFFLSLVVYEYVK